MHRIALTTTRVPAGAPSFCFRSPIRTGRTYRGGAARSNRPTERMRGTPPAEPTLHAKHDPRQTTERRGDTSVEAACHGRTRQALRQGFPGPAERHERAGVHRGWANAEDPISMASRSTIAARCVSGFGALLVVSCMTAHAQAKESAM